MSRFKLFNKWALKVIDSEYKDTIDDDFNPDMVQLALADTYEKGVKHSAIVTALGAGAVVIGKVIQDYIHRKKELHKHVEMDEAAALDQIGDLITDYSLYLHREEPKVVLMADDVAALRIAFEVLKAKWMGEQK